jgi:hypothetical protein
MTGSTTEFGKARRVFLKLTVIGGVVLAIGIALSLQPINLGESTITVTPERIWSNLLIASFYLVSLGLGGALFIALTYISGAAWNVGFRRVPEALTGLLPIGSVGLLVVLAARMHKYAWHHHGTGDAGTFWFKELWSATPFWAGRAVVYVVLWVLLSRALVAVSRRQDVSGDVGLTVANKRLSALFLVVYAITFSLAACDWLMLLEPMWFSTAWGVYNFAGMTQATLAATVVLCLVLRARGGPLRNAFTNDHLHDLGKLLLGFSCFWMYIWFSQYMLIWYSNIPEETAYFIPRTHGPWGPIMIVNIVLNWIVPFFFLLPRPCKRSESIMMKVAVVVLIGRWLDLYLMVFPAFSESFGKTPLFGIWEVVSVMSIVGVFGLVYFRAFFAAAPVPRRDPLLGESLHYHC